MVFKAHASHAPPHIGTHSGQEELSLDVAITPDPLGLNSHLIPSRVGPVVLCGAGCGRKYLRSQVQCILFRDVTTLLLDHRAFKDTTDIFVERYKDKKIDVVVGIEARGFIFGPPIALAIGAKFVPQRKPKKLPGEVVRQEYSLEYGTDCIEMHVGAVQPGDRCVIVDDLIATGGTLAAGIQLIERVGAEVVECACLVELSELKGRDKLSGKPLFVLVDYEGE